MRALSSPGVLESLLDALGAAAYLNLSVSWVYKAAERGELPCLRIGSALRFEPESLRAWVKTKARQPLRRLNPTSSLTKV